MLGDRNVTANFSSPNPGLTVALSPSAQTVVQGQAASFAVTIGGFSGHLNIFATAVPPASTVQFSSSGPLTLTIRTSANTPPGTYPVTVRAADDTGTLVQTASANLTVTAAASGGSAGGGGGGGGGGVAGGGGGSSSLALSVTPASQTVASGSAASWTISVTNTGGAYLYAVGVRDDAAPGCGIPSSFADTASFMAPGVTISYSCSLAAVTSSLTNTVIATATTGPGDLLTQTATATVTVQAAAAQTPTPHAPATVAKPHAIIGTARADHLTGTARNDVINGLAGNDVINGGRGNDTIFGGPGNDRLNGGPGKDKLFGGAGKDTILTADGSKDTVDCGPGRDTVTADKTDAVAKNCELVHRR